MRFTPAPMPRYSTGLLSKNIESIKPSSFKRLTNASSSVTPNVALTNDLRSKLQDPLALRPILSKTTTSTAVRPKQTVATDTNSTTIRRDSKPFSTKMKLLPKLKPMTFGSSIRHQRSTRTSVESTEELDQKLSEIPDVQQQQHPKKLSLNSKNQNSTTDKQIDIISWDEHFTLLDQIFTATDRTNSQFEWLMVDDTYSTLEEKLINYQNETKSLRIKANPGAKDVQTIESIQQLVLRLLGSYQDIRDLSLSFRKPSFEDEILNILEQTHDKAIAL